MSIHIEKHCQTPLPWNIERRIQRLLRAVPQEHLIGLETIRLVDRVTDKQHPDAAGLYRRELDRPSGIIEIAVGRGGERIPRLLFFLPLIGQFILARILYHEVGHHYQYRLTHGVKREKAEPLVEQYKRRMLRRAFSGWRLVLAPLAPLSPLIRRLGHALEKRQKGKTRNSHRAG